MLSKDEASQAARESHYDRMLRETSIEAANRRAAIYPDPPKMALTKDNMELEKGGVKRDQDKNRLDLLPMDAVAAIGEILTFGAQKYDDHNWLKGMRWGRVLASVLGHLFAFALGEDNDRETGKPHLAHAGCGILFLLTYQLRGLGTDDRIKVDGFKVR